MLCQSFSLLSWFSPWPQFTLSPHVRNMTKGHGVHLYKGSVGVKMVFSTFCIFCSPWLMKVVLGFIRNWSTFHIVCCKINRPQLDRTLYCHYLCDLWNCKEETHWFFSHHTVIPQLGQYGILLGSLTFLAVCDRYLVKFTFWQKKLTFSSLGYSQYRNGQSAQIVQERSAGHKLFQDIGLTIRRPKTSWASTYQFEKMSSWASTWQ